MREHLRIGLARIDGFLRPEVRTLRSEIDVLAGKFFDGIPSSVSYLVEGGRAFGFPELTPFQFFPTRPNFEAAILKVSGFFLTDPETKGKAVLLDVTLSKPEKHALTINLEEGWSRLDYSQDERPHRYRTRGNELLRLKIIKRVLSALVELKNEGLLRDERTGVLSLQLPLSELQEPVDAIDPVSIVEDPTADFLPLSPNIERSVTDLVSRSDSQLALSMPESTEGTTGSGGVFPLRPAKRS